MFYYFSDHIFINVYNFYLFFKSHGHSSFTIRLLASVAITEDIVYENGKAFQKRPCSRKVLGGAQESGKSFASWLEL